jgi:2-succinyl-5-enolpyruvyl-6-hydroxy-3-cyclohexene-1-carboxylate synthase
MGPGAATVGRVGGAYHDEPNLNAAWARLLIETCVAQGVTYFVISPGSRSTPLVRAVIADNRTEAVLWLDERGAGFHALGHARATGRPAAVITTSGTAVANLLPAAVEATADGVPLLLLTADRPPELVDVGASQAVRQPGLFGDHVRLALDLPTPDASVPLRHGAYLLAQALATARCAPRGAVHVNVRLREPLTPVREAFPEGALAGLDGEAPAPHRTPSHVIPRGPALGRERSRIASRWLDQAKGLVVAAGPCPADVVGLAERLGWPLLADLRSGHRLGRDRDVHCPHIDRMLGSVWQPEVVLQLGSRPLSKRYAQWLQGTPGVGLLVADDQLLQADPAARAVEHIVAAPERVVDELLAHFLEEGADDRRPPTATIERDRAIEEAIQDTLDRPVDEPLVEPQVARWISEHVDGAHALFVSNSLPVRMLQGFARRDGPEVPVGLNRGASGIDGIVSSAAGFAAGADRPTTVLLGDQAFLHDLNALAGLLRGGGPPLTLVILNNGGGGIFHTLPVAAWPDLLTPWLDARHDLDFESVCNGFGLAYRRVGTEHELAQCYEEAAQAGDHAVIEVMTSMDATRAALREVDAAVRLVLEDTDA